MSDERARSFSASTASAADDGARGTGTTRVKRGLADMMKGGVIMDVVRNSPHGIEVRIAVSAWPESDQALRCLESLVNDGLVRRRGNLVSL